MRQLPVPPGIASIVGIAACACIVSSCALFGPSGPTLTYPALLESMVDLDSLWRAPRSGERCVQFSSFDQKSRKGPADHGAWYANHDRGQYLRVEERAGPDGKDRKEYVMMDAAGPACVMRIWSANPKGRIFFYVDGAKEPTFEADFARLLSGGVAPFVQPIAGKRARGCNLYAPLPFARHLKITTTQKDCYYQVNVRHFAQGIGVESFAADTFARHADDIAGLAARLGDLDRPLAGEWREVRGRVAKLEGPGVLRGLRVRLRPKAGSTLPLNHLLRRELLVVRVGGDKTLVCVPVADFFGAAPDFMPYAGLTMGVTADGWGYCRFPMPVAGAMTIALATDGGMSSNADCEIRTLFEKRPLPVDHLEFRAAFHHRKDIKTRPFSDHRVLDASGPGRFVGCALSVYNPTKTWWGEGDEKFFVDGEDFPSTFGTGTEDYFGYAWCNTELFSSAFHNQVQCDGPRNAGYTCVNRFHIADQVPFHSSFLFDLEVWHWKKKITVDYASTAWWYAAPAAQAALPPMDPAEERLPRNYSPPAPMKVPDALEGEDLATVKIDAGKREAQATDSYDERWSNDTHLWWHGAKKGDRLTLRLPDRQAPARYILFARFTKAIDYGIVQVEVNGQKVGAPQDLYNKGVVPTAEVELGTVRLKGKDDTLTLHLVGANEKAVKKYMAGLDYVRLVLD